MRLHRGISICTLELLLIIATQCFGKDVPNNPNASVETDDDAGENFCNTGVDSCFCDTGIKPIQIICDSLELKNIYEEADWKATFKFLNITGEEPMDVSFVNNEIEDIPRLPRMNAIVLNFHRNKIRSISRFAFADMEKLDTLNLADNELQAESLAEEVFFGKYRNDSDDPGYFTLPIQHLNLSRNFIHSIDSKAFDHLISLRTLDLGYNPLKILSSTARAISELRKLEYLGLRNTSISSLPEGMLHDLKTLSALDISNNLFTTVPPELAHTHKLAYLCLDGNKLAKLDADSFTNLDWLEDLSIRYVNTLQTIENFTFTPLVKLEKLDISFNRRLNEIEGAAFTELVTPNTTDSWTIRDLRLNDNGLTHIDAAMLPWTQVDYIDIQNNPFRCDCNLEWMVSVLVGRIRQSNPNLAVDLTCAEPPDMKGRLIKSLAEDPVRFSRCRPGSSDDWPNERSDPYRAAGITILVIGILLIIIGTAILGFAILKRRAITTALLSPSTIRYERAETDERTDFVPGNGQKYNLPSSIYK